MLVKGIESNESTFFFILLFCSILGMVEEGLKYFNFMKWEYGIYFGIEYYGCMFDFLGRRGNLDLVLYFIEEMFLGLIFRIWGFLLVVSRNSKNMEFV